MPDFYRAKHAAPYGPRSCRAATERAEDHIPRHSPRHGVDSHLVERMAQAIFMLAFFGFLAWVVIDKRLEERWLKRLSEAHHEGDFPARDEPVEEIR